MKEKLVSSILSIVILLVAISCGDDSPVSKQRNVTAQQLFGNKKIDRLNDLNKFKHIPCDDHVLTVNALITEWGYEIYKDMFVITACMHKSDYSVAHYKYVFDYKLESILVYSQK